MGRRRWKLRFSLLTIFLAIAFAALVSMALRDPLGWCSDLCVLCTVFCLAALVARCFACRDWSKRAAAIGAATFGVGYFALIFNGIFFEALQQSLPTSLALGAVYEFVHGVDEEVDPAPQTVAEFMRQPRPDIGNLENAASEEPPLDVWPARDSSTYPGDLPPGLVAFSQVGHCAFALLFALAGGVLAHAWAGSHPPLERVAA